MKAFKKLACKNLACKHLVCTAALLTVFAAPAFAETVIIHDGDAPVVVAPVPEATVQSNTVVTHTYTQNQDVAGAEPVNFTALDINADGAYSMAEVGEFLYRAFDTDGNGMIDNIEWDTPKVLTITPMEKETFKYVDVGSDGVVDASSYTYETFYKASGLLKFDNDLDGLSAKDFIGAGYQEVDDDNDQLISLEEWKEIYLGSLPKHAQPENYN